MRLIVCYVPSATEVVLSCELGKNKVSLHRISIPSGMQRSVENNQTRWGGAPHPDRAATLVKTLHAASPQAPATPLPVTCYCFYHVLKPKHTGNRSFYHVLKPKHTGNRSFYHVLKPKHTGNRSFYHILKPKHTGNRSFYHILKSKHAGNRSFYHILKPKYTGNRSFPTFFKSKHNFIYKHIY